MKKIILLFVLGFSGFANAVTPASVFSDNSALLHKNYLYSFCTSYIK